MIKTFLENRYGKKQDRNKEETKKLAMNAEAALLQLIRNLQEVNPDGDASLSQAEVIARKTLKELRRITRFLQ